MEGPRVIARGLESVPTAQETKLRQGDGFSSTLPVNHYLIRARVCHTHMQQDVIPDIVLRGFQENGN
jgi:hypothetical protein